MKQIQNINISSRSIITDDDKHVKEIDANDILFGRGSAFYNNPGNVAFRKMIHVELVQYSIHTPRSVKGDIIQSLIAKAKEQGRRFMVCSLENGKWVEANPTLIRSKVSHALRDARHAILNSPTPKKTKFLHGKDRRRQKHLSILNQTRNSNSFSIQQNYNLQSENIERKKIPASKRAGPMKAKHNYSYKSCAEMSVSNQFHDITLASNTNIVRKNNSHNMTIECTRKEYSKYDNNNYESPLIVSPSHPGNSGSRLSSDIHQCLMPMSHKDDDMLMYATTLLALSSIHRPTLNRGISISKNTTSSHIEDNSNQSWTKMGYELSLSLPTDIWCQGSS